MNERPSIVLCRNFRCPVHKVQSRKAALPFKCGTRDDCNGSSGWGSGSYDKSG